MLRPTFTIEIGGFRSTSDQPGGGPSDLVIDRDLDVAADSLRLRLFDRAGIAVGDAVSVELGHDGQNEVAFTGTVAAVRADLTGATVHALGATAGLLDLRTAATYENRTAGSIVSDLISQAGLSGGTVDDGPTLPFFAVDRRESGWQHARALADRLGFDLYADRRGQIHFRGLGAAASLGIGALSGAITSAAGGESYAFGKHLLAATGTRTAPGAGTVDVGGESPMSGQGDTTGRWLTTADADYRGSDGSGAPRLLVIDAAARTKDLADRFAAGWRLHLSRRAARFEAEVLGRPALELGDSVQTSDAPDDLVNGSGHVCAIRHRFGAAIGFVTRVGVQGTP